MEVHQLLCSRRCPLANTAQLTTSKSKLKSLYDWQFTINQFVLASSSLSLRTILSAPISLLITSWHVPRREHLFQKFPYCWVWIRCRVNMFACQRRYSLMAAYVCQLKICCLAAVLFRCLYRGRYPATGLAKYLFI
jgi:hypothetical protein